MSDVSSITITGVTVAPKKVSTTYILWVFFAAIGGHQFYLGNTGRAISYILTFGWVGVGTIIDVFTLPAQVAKANARRAATAA